MVSRVEKIVFRIRDSVFELYGEKRKVWNRKRKRISWSRLLYEFLRKALEINGFQVSDQKIDGK